MKRHRSTRIKSRKEFNYEWRKGGGFLSDDADYSFKLKIEGESILTLHLAGMHRCINDGRFQCGAVPLKPVIIVMVIKRVNK